MFRNIIYCVVKAVQSVYSSLQFSIAILQYSIYTLLQVLLKIFYRCCIHKSARRINDTSEHKTKILGEIFFYRAYIEGQVYKDNISNITHLKRKIVEEFEKLRNDISLHSVQMLIRRANLCMQQRGGHFFQQCLQ